MYDCLLICIPSFTTGTDNYTHPAVDDDTALYDEGALHLDSMHDETLYSFISLNVIQYQINK